MLHTTLPFPWVKMLPGQADVKKYLHPSPVLPQAWWAGRFLIHRMDPNPRCQGQGHQQNQQLLLTQPHGRHIF